jgi:hypothetical protein
MKSMILAALAVLSLGADTAFAQGKPPGDDLRCSHKYESIPLRCEL